MEHLIGNTITYADNDDFYLWYDGVRQFKYVYDEKMYIFSSYTDMKINGEWYYLYIISEIEEKDINNYSPPQTAKDGIYVGIIQYTNDKDILVDVFETNSFDFY